MYLPFGHIERDFPFGQGGHLVGKQVVALQPLVLRPYEIVVSAWNEQGVRDYRHRPATSGQGVCGARYREGRTVEDEYSEVRRAYYDVATCLVFHEFAYKCIRQRSGGFRREHYPALHVQAGRIEYLHPAFSRRRPYLAVGIREYPSDRPAGEQGVHSGTPVAEDHIAIGIQYVYPVLVCAYPDFGLSCAEAYLCNVGDVVRGARERGVLVEYHGRKDTVRRVVGLEPARRGHPHRSPAVLERTEDQVAGEGPAGTPVGLEMAENAPVESGESVS